MREGGRKGRFGAPMPPCAVAEFGSSRIRSSVVGRVGACLACCCSARPKGIFPQSLTGTPGSS